MYWNVGGYLSKEGESATFGDSYLDSVAKEIWDIFPRIKGFNRCGLYRKKFYETCNGDEFVTTLLIQISCSNHLDIISEAKLRKRDIFI